MSISLGSVALVLAVALGWSLLGSVDVPPVMRIALSPVPGVNPTGRHRGFAVSPDGSRMVFVEYPGGQLYYRDLGQLDAEPVSGVENAWYPFFAPDGEWVGYFDEQENVLKKTRLDRREVQTLVPVPGDLRSAGWGSDGTIVLHTNALDGLSRVRDTGGDLETIADTEGGLLLWLDLLPGGRAVVGSQRIGEVEHVVSVSLETGERTVLFPGTTPRFVRSGHVVFWRDDAVWAVRFDTEQLAAVGEPTPIVEGVAREPTNGLARFAVGGDQLFYQEGNLEEPQPLLLGRDGSAEALDPSLSGAVGAPAVSPDGRRIAFEYNTPADGTQDIWIHDLDQETFSRLTFEGDLNRYPFWSPGGSEVGFSSDRDNLSALYARPVDLSAETRLLFADPDEALFEGSWTPDGRRLLYRRRSALTRGALDLWYAEPGSNNPAVAILETPAAEQNPSLSPDGRWLAYVSNESGRNEVYVRPFPGPGGRAQISTDGGISPVWAHTGREVFYLELAAETLTVASVRTDPTFAVESRERLFAWVYSAALSHPAFDLLPEDQRILAIGVPREAEGGGRHVGVLNFLEELERLVPE